jgi:ATP-dependent DNA helicase DinG
LSNVIVWSLPLPPHDPVMMAKRQDAASPYDDVELPFMLLRLRQGLGRLIRSREDSGAVVLLDERLHERPDLRARVSALLPRGVVLTDSCV